MPKPWTFGLLKPDALANPISLTWILDAIHRKGLFIREGKWQNLILIIIIN